MLVAPWRSLGLGWLLPGRAPSLYGSQARGGSGECDVSVNQDPCTSVSLGLGVVCWLPTCVRGSSCQRGMWVDGFGFLGPLVGSFGVGAASFCGGHSLKTRAAEACRALDTSI